MFLVRSDVKVDLNFFSNKYLITLYSESEKKVHKTKKNVLCVLPQPIL